MSDSVSPNLADRLAAAAEERSRQNAQPQQSVAQMSMERDRKQMFRRLIDPGIVRPNSKEQAAASLKVHAAMLFSVVLDSDQILG
jgi:hypothetical protein